MIPSYLLIVAMIFMVNKINKIDKYKTLSKDNEILLSSLFSVSFLQFSAPTVMAKCRLDCQGFVSCELTCKQSAFCEGECYCQNSPSKRIDCKKHKGFPNELGGIINKKQRFWWLQ